MDSPPPRRPVRRELILFAAVTAMITCGTWLVLATAGLETRSGPGLWIFAVCTSGPSLAALVLVIARVITRGRKRDLPGQRVSAPWLWAPAALVLGAAPATIGTAVANPGGLTAGIDAAPPVLAQFGGGLSFVVLFLIAGPLAEEFGWRGFMQPRLRTRLGVLGTSLALGLAWGAWHIPLYFLPGTGQGDEGLFTLGGLVFMLSCIPLSFIYLFVSERLGGGVWAAILLHFSGNAIDAFLPANDAAVLIAELLVTVEVAALLLLLWGRGDRYALTAAGSERQGGCSRRFPDTDKTQEFLR